MPVFSDGTQEWVTDGESKGVVAFVRRHGGTAVFVAANLTESPVEFQVASVRPSKNAKPILAERGSMSADGACRLDPWGYVAVGANP